MRSKMKKVCKEKREKNDIHIIFCIGVKRTISQIYPHPLGVII